MNKKERVKAAIRKEKVGYVPSCFSLHFPRETAFGEDAVKAHLEFYHATDTDILKVMNDHSLNLLHINPGAAGNSGFHRVVTMVRFQIDGSEIQKMEVYEKSRNQII